MRVPEKCVRITCRRYENLIEVAGRDLEAGCHNVVNGTFLGEAYIYRMNL